MAEIRFDDGEAYEQGMGVWSRLVGEIFLGWVAPQPGLRWVDVGCGNGAFTDLVMQRCAPGEMQAIDPSEGQLKFARTRPGAKGAVFQQGDAMALPFEANRFDAAVMALVLFFVPQPSKGVAEMVRVVRPGGSVSAYVWDVLSGRWPVGMVQRECKTIGIDLPLPPSAEISQMAALRGAWQQAGLTDVETREITVERIFADFDDFWNSTLKIGSLAAAMKELDAGKVAQVKTLLREKLPAGADGRITQTAYANAIKGRVPG